VQYDSLLIRALDISLASILLLVSALPMLGIAIAILLDTGRPFLFRQTRVGKERHHFTIFKFRSMRLEAKTISHTSGQSEEEKLRLRREVSTKKNDPRITRTGRFIRKTHLDELPQLLNVLRGDMSLVGVRPDTPAQELDYDDDYWVFRHRFRPGITGLAQIMNGSTGGMSGRCHWEKQWLEQRSVALYFSILAKTLAKMLKRNSF
jgi:lipopolysaccharide/colanic/teichoic acid biosynthesis glycosyltransferase